MLTALHLGNFKAFADTQNIPIRPITLIFGPNSAGKSSIIHSLALAHEASRKGDLNIYRTELGGNSIDLGGFRQYVHRRQTNRRVEWGATFDTSRFNGRLADLLKPVNSISIHLTMGIELDNEDRPIAGTTPTVISYELESRGELLIRMSRRPDGSMAVDRLNHEHPVIRQIITAVLESSTTTQKVNSDDYAALTDTIADIVSSLRATGGIFLPEGLVDKRQQADEGLSSLSLFSVSKGNRAEDLARALRFFLPRSLNELITGLSSTTQGEFKRIQYLGPLRSYPPRHLAFSEHDDVNWYAGGGYAWDVVRRNEAVRAKVNNWLNNPGRLKTPYELIVHSLMAHESIQAAHEELLETFVEKYIEDRQSETYEYEIADLQEDMSDIFKKVIAPASWPHVQELILKDKRTDTEVSHRDVGIGVSQVLPVLVGAYASQNQIIAIEQPEIHLHPALQAELGDVFIESALGEQKNTFILETHSEHLILRLLRRIRETNEGELPEVATPLRADQLAILYVQPGLQKNVGSEVIEIPVSEDGEFMKPWPDGFFAERAKELF